MAAVMVWVVQSMTQILSRYPAVQNRVRLAVAMHIEVTGSPGMRTRATMLLVLQSIASRQLLDCPPTHRVLAAESYARHVTIFTPFIESGSGIQSSNHWAPTSPGRSR